LTLGGRETGDGVNLWLVDCDAGDSNPLLHDLKPDHQLHATSGVELAGTDTEKHVEIRVVLGSLPLELGDVADVLKLSLGLTHVCTSLTTKSTQDIARFFLTPDLGKPTWRFREEPDDAEEEEKRYDLECDGEPPNKAGCSVPVEGAAAVDRSALNETKMREGNVLFQPVSHDNTKDVEGELDGNELTTRLVLRGLGRPDGNNGVQDTGAPSVDQTCWKDVQSAYHRSLPAQDEKRTENHPDVILSGGLETCAENSPGSAKGNRLDPTIAIAKPSTNETADEGTEVVDRDLRPVRKSPSTTNLGDGHTMPPCSSVLS